MLHLESCAEMSTIHSSLCSKLVLVSKVNVRHRPSHARAEIWRGKVRPIVISLKNVIVHTVSVASLVVVPLLLIFHCNFSCFCLVTSPTRLVFVRKARIEANILKLKIHITMYVKT